jgi:hypothetical protein
VASLRKTIYLYFTISEHLEFGLTRGMASGGSGLVRRLLFTNWQHFAILGHINKRNGFSDLHLQEYQF